MPDLTPFMVGARYPNLGITSLAANVDDATVRCYDLQLAKDVDATLKKLMTEFDPDVVGLSAMTFLYPNALEIADKVKCLKPTVRTVLGGYHATSAYDEIGTSYGSRLFDFLVKGEAEVSFNELIQALMCGDNRFDKIDGLSYWNNGDLVHNPLPANIDLAKIKLPARHKRLANNFHGWGERLDMIETSRGCILPCTYCSIRKMYGPNYRQYDIDRVVEDLLIMRSLGVKQAVITDDNITLKIDRLKALCRRVIEAKIELRWKMQATVAGIAADEELSELLSRAGVYQVYLGIEHLDKKTLKSFKKGSSPHKTLRAVKNLRKYGIQVFGGFIIGAPTDSRETIKDLVEQIRVMDLDVPHLGILVPLPGTELTQELGERGLITNLDDYSKYSFDFANIRTEHLSAKELVRLRNWAHASLYLDPRIRAGRHFYKQLARPYMLLTVYSYLRQMLGSAINKEPTAQRFRFLEDN
jgi:anaerobic magnesium-protoporphyrin IX monomethyl ester cyclase